MGWADDYRSHDLPAPASPTAETAAPNGGAFDDRDADGGIADPLNGQTEGSLDPDGFDGAGFEGPGFAPVTAPPSVPAAAAKRKTGSANGKTATAAPGAAPATGGEEYPPFNQNVPLEIMRELYNPQTQQAGLKRYAHYKKQGAFNEAQTMAIESILKDAGLPSPA